MNTYTINSSNSNTTTSYYPNAYINNSNDYYTVSDCINVTMTVNVTYVNSCYQMFAFLSEEDQKIEEVIRRLDSWREYES